MLNILLMHLNVINYKIGKINMAKCSCMVTFMMYPVKLTL